MNYTLFSTVGLNLLIMVIVIIFFGFISKKCKIMKQNSVKHLKVIGCIPISTKEKIAIVEFYNKKILVGITPGNIQTLAEHHTKGS